MARVRDTAGPASGVFFGITGEDVLREERWRRQQELGIIPEVATGILNASEMRTKG